MKRKGSTFLLVITVMLFAIAMTLAVLAVYIRTTGYELVRTADGNSAESPELDFDKLVAMDEIIEKSYLGEYNKESARENLYRALVESLDDPYSRYLDADELIQLQQGVNSSYTGTGIVFVENGDGEFVITEVVSGGPAASIGIQTQDIILSIDGKTPKNTEEVSKALRGDPGTEVKIRVKRNNETSDFSLIRGEIQGASVESNMIDDENLGYIKIKSFGEDTYSQFDSALSGFEKSGVDGVIIDIRNNPGGIFDSGIEIADRLLKECAISYTIDHSDERQNFNSDSKSTNLPYVILINENTASTGEMLAAAIKENTEMPLIGTETYGKGLMQETHVFSDGSAINITTKEFFTPNGEKIDGIGVKPDILVKNSGEGTKDLQLERAIRELLSE